MKLKNIIDDLKKKRKKKLLKQKRKKELESGLKKLDKINNKIKTDIKAIRSFQHFQKHKKQYSKKNIKDKLKKTHLQAIIFNPPNTWVNIAITNDKDYFIHENRSYVYDEKALTEYNGKPALFYHRDISIPFRLEFSGTEIRDKLQDEDIKISLNPIILKRFIVEEFVQKLMSGKKMLSDIGMMKIMIIFNMLLTGVCVILLLKNGV